MLSWLMTILPFRLARAVLTVAMLATRAAVAQPAATTLPSASDPPTTTPTRYELMMPPGFSAITVGPRTALCEPPDESWVRQVLGEIEPTTLPSTMPADIVHRLVERRELIRARLATDLALPDPGLADTLLNETLIAQARRLGDIEPPVFYLVCSDTKLKELVKGGWKDPRFYYNRAADDVAFDPGLRLSDDRLMDDMVMPVLFPAGAAEDVKRRGLIEIVRRNEAAIADAIARRGIVITQLALIQFIHANGIEPLKLTEDQLWFGYGVEAVLSARYMADVAGLDFDDLVARMTHDNRRNPIRTETIDLLHPTSRAEMRPEWVPLYGDAYRAKSARVIYQWIKQAGDSAVSMTITAMRNKTPPDGAALVKLIHLTTNVDLSDAVKAH
jgi:hypothetical protein